jgi:hypothetical protein
MTAKLADRERWRRELFSAAPLDIATDALADVVFSVIWSARLSWLVRRGRR